MKKVVLLTGSELRHEFFRKLISNQEDIKVLSSYCESLKGNLRENINKENHGKRLRVKHLDERTNFEKKFFGSYCKNINDKSNPVFIERGDINNKDHVKKIIRLKPDIIISYGCSIINSDLLTRFKRKFVNIHLGLSPYYRGSGTNFWPFVNNELQYVGTTFMYIDEGVDTGEVIHQIRPKIKLKDNIHQIGNRLIKDSCFECIKLIKNFENLSDMDQVKIDKKEVRYYRKKDFTEDSIEKTYNNLAKGIINEYLSNKVKIDSKVQIIKNTGIV